MKILTPTFFARDTVEVARDLLGKTLIRHHEGKVLAGIIIETEAYRGHDDAASHAYRRKTPRNTAMFGPVGCAYVYFVYGNHFCLNIVARSNQFEAGAVLIRAVFPTQGIAHMQHARGRNDRLADGPGKLAQAFIITRAHNGYDMTRQGALYVIDESITVSIQTAARIGISAAIEKPWRFYSGTDFAS